MATEIVLDIIFPNNVSRWRSEEICYYMEKLGVDAGTGSYVPHLGPLDTQLLQDSMKDYPAAWQGYHFVYTEAQPPASLELANVPGALHKPRAAAYEYHISRSGVPKNLSTYNLFYTIFLSQAQGVVQAAEAQGKKVVWELYPAGGFTYELYWIDDAVRACAESSAVSKVIITQPRVLDYVVGKKLVPLEKIYYLFGCTLRSPPGYHTRNKKRFQSSEDREVIHVAYVSASGSYHKGLFRVAEAVRHFAKDGRLHFHLAGNISQEVLQKEFPAAGANWTYHGWLRNREQLHAFYHDTADVLLSPATVGHYEEDGYPLGVVTEALLYGVAVILHDPHADNAGVQGLAFLEHGKHAFFLPEATGSAVINALLWCLENPTEVSRVAEQGRSWAEKVYNEEIQLKPRAGILRHFSRGQLVTGHVTARVDQILAKIPVDNGGGCPRSKALLLAEYALIHVATKVIDIGVYRGRSFFPLALAMEMNNGHVWGVDPYSSGEAFQPDLEGEGAALKDVLHSWRSTTPFEQVFQEVKRLLTAETLSHCGSLVRATSARAAVLLEKFAPFDMVHVDGNHDAEHVREDIRAYLPLLRVGGLLIMDDINLPGVQRALGELEETREVLRGMTYWIPEEFVYWRVYNKL